MVLRIVVGYKMNHAKGYVPIFREIMGPSTIEAWKYMVVLKRINNVIFQSTWGSRISMIKVNNDNLIMTYIQLGN